MPIKTDSAQNGENEASGGTEETLQNLLNVSIKMKGSSLRRSSLDLQGYSSRLSEVSSYFTELMHHSDSKKYCVPTKLKCHFILQMSKFLTIYCQN